MTAGQADELDSLLDALCRYPSTEKEAAKIFDRVLSQVVERHIQLCLLNSNCK
jgi:hypothetical protein